MAKRLYYKIGEACKELDIQPYVLRYWETEFPVLSPTKSSSGQRVYSEKELALIRRIKELLYEEGYTIAGAKKKLEGELASGRVPERPTAGAAADGKGAKGAKRGKAAKGGGRKRAATGAARLDTSDDGEIEKLREGVRKALDEARQILSRLERTPPS